MPMEYLEKLLLHLHCFRTSHMSHVRTDDHNVFKLKPASVRQFTSPVLFTINLFTSFHVIL